VQVFEGEQGEVCLECSSVGRGFIYPEEVSAQVGGAGGRSCNLCAQRVVAGSLALAVVHSCASPQKSLAALPGAAGGAEA